MKEEKPILTNTDEVLMYGDRVRFHWVDEDYVYNQDLELSWEGDLEGLYAGPWTNNPKLAIVTVVTPGHYRGLVLYPYIKDLKRIEHPEIKDCKKTEKKYDKITLEKMRENVIENFDFGKMHTVMTALGWEWWGKGVPSEETITEAAQQLLDEVISEHLKDGKSKCISTGGFEASLTVYEDECIPELSLKFVVEDWYEGGDCFEEYEKDYTVRHSGGENGKKKKHTEDPARKLKTTGPDTTVSRQFIQND